MRYDQERAQWWVLHEIHDGGGEGVILTLPGVPLAGEPPHGYIASRLQATGQQHTTAYSQSALCLPQSRAHKLFLENAWPKWECPVFPDSFIQLLEKDEGENVGAGGLTL